MANLLGFILVVILIGVFSDYLIKEIFVYPREPDNLDADKVPEFQGSFKEFIKWLFSKRGGH